MGLSIEAIKTILDIKEDVVMTEQEMARSLKAAFYPHISENTSKKVREFAARLEQTLKKLGVEIIPYEQTLEPICLKRKLGMLANMLGMSIKNILSGRFELFRFNFGKKVKKGIAIIQTGEGKTGDLPVDHVLSLRENPMILITDQPQQITEKSAFKEHLEASLPIFSWNITNLVVSVGKTHWTVYSFNMSYPMHHIDGDFEKDVLHALAPKIYAPVIPPRIDDFEIHNSAFGTDDDQYKPYIKDLIESGPILEKTNLYPEPKKISEFKFRNAFYRWLGSLLLDKRSGMSYGFIARQLPMGLSQVRESSERESKKDYFFKDKNLHIRFAYSGKTYEMKVPDVWVLTSRSGSDKTKLNPKTDIVKMGLANGKMIMETPKGISVGPDYKPSFDTKVILAHSVANAIFASIAKHFNPDSEFADEFASSGRSLAHWHGYFDPACLPEGWHSYGENNPPVSCSAPQGAVYAFKGKEELFMRMIKNNLPYEADIHIESQHGSNVSFLSLKNLGEFLLKNKNITKLGNEYLAFYT